jgi:hypothetical protein
MDIQQSSWSKEKTMFGNKQQHIVCAHANLHGGTTWILRFPNGWGVSIFDEYGDVGGGNVTPDNEDMLIEMTVKRFAGEQDNSGTVQSNDPLHNEFRTDCGIMLVEVGQVSDVLETVGLRLSLFN